MELVRKAVGFIRARFNPPSARYDVQVEEYIELQGCTLIGPIEIGFRSYANDSLIRNAEIGRFCSIGRRCSIGAAKHDVSAFTTHPIGAGPTFVGGPRTVIGNDVWIGDNVVIVAGVSIGDGACIGAGAIVTKDVEPYAIMGGVPAKLLRWRFKPEVSRDLIASKWWTFGDGAVAVARDVASPTALVNAITTSKLAPLPAHFKPWRS